MEQEENNKGGFIARLKKRVRNLFTANGSLTKYYVMLGVVATITIALGAIYFIFTSNLERQQEVGGQKANVAIPYKPSPAPLASGPQTYEVSGSKEGAPKIARATIDPIDPPQNSTQNWDVYVLDAENGPVTEVTVTLFTDNGNESFPLQLTEGTDTNGTWTGGYRITDSYDYTYIGVLRARNEAGEIHKVDLVLR